jgi:Glycosyltransferase family 9 (heptosyltransferase)
LNVHGQWAEALRRNDFQRAWELSDASLNEYCLSGAIKHAGERHLQRIWRGEDLKDRSILVRCYHGLGDTIQFIRFARPLREVAREVTVWCQPELLSLVRQVDGVDRVLPLHDGTADASFEVDIEIMELAHALRATPQLITGSVPYFPRARRKMPSSSRLSVGIVWEAGNWNPNRSVPAHLFGRLRQEADVRLLSFQQGKARALAAMIPAEDVAVPDIEVLAARIMQVDLVITVDTMVAHLAGALGAPVWTMLHRDCDWRWPETGRHTVWYPTMRLFHQQTAGDWTGVVEEITEELKSLRGTLPARQDSAAQHERSEREGTR